MGYRHGERIGGVRTGKFYPWQKDPEHRLDLGLSAAPVPTTAFFTSRAAYSATPRPARAKASRQTPRA